MPHHHALDLAFPVLALLRDAPGGARPLECWQTLTKRPRYRTVSYLTLYQALRWLCVHHLVIKVARGRYGVAPPSPTP